MFGVGRPRPKTEGVAADASARAGLVFPTTTAEKFFHGMRMTSSARSYLAAVLEYMTAEMMELSGNAARDNDRKLCTSCSSLLMR